MTVRWRCPTGGLAASISAAPILQMNRRRGWITRSTGLKSLSPPVSRPDPACATFRPPVAPPGVPFLNGRSAIGPARTHPRRSFFMSLINLVITLVVVIAVVVWLLRALGVLGDIGGMRIGG